MLSMNTWLGIDWGRRRIGLALSAPGGLYATPLAVVSVARPGEEWAEIRRLSDEYEVDGYVVGVPLETDGAEGPMAAEVRRWAAGLAKRCGRPVRLADERWSSAWADDALGEHGVDAERRHEISDALAAQTMLESWLQKQRDAS